MFLVAAGLLFVTQPNYKLVWSDEFNDKKIDSKKWSYEVNGAGGGNHELQYYTDRSENSRIEDGHLVIEARKESFTGPDGKRDYTSARMVTKKKGDWKYGAFEIRAKLPQGAGMWPAIWMMPTDDAYGGWPASGEIDIMEQIGKEPNTVHGTLHYGTDWQHHLFTGGQTDISKPETFHVYRLEWEAKEMRWYLDGKLYLTQSKWSTKEPYPAPFDKRFFMILNVAVGGDWPGPPNDSTQFPQKMSVDYIRVYQKQ